MLLHPEKWLKCSSADVWSRYITSLFHQAAQVRWTFLHVASPSLFPPPGEVRSLWLRVGRSGAGVHVQQRRGLLPPHRQQHGIGPRLRHRHAARQPLQGHLLPEVRRVKSNQCSHHFSSLSLDCYPIWALVRTSLETSAVKEAFINIPLLSEKIWRSFHYRLPTRFSEINVKSLLLERSLFAALEKIKWDICLPNVRRQNTLSQLHNFKPPR